MIPHRTPFFLPIFYPSARWRMPSPGGKDLYLTFDDGPVPGPTEFVLETLQKFDVKATFFCIGDNVRKHPTIFKKLIQDNHSIGNHTQHHISGWSHSVDDYVRDVHACQSEFILQGLTEGPKLFRPPYGRIKFRQVKALSDYTLVMWDVLTQDYRKTLSPEKCLSNTLAVVRPGSIVVFHDSVKASANLRYVLPRFLESCLNKGFRFITLHS